MASAGIQTDEIGSKSDETTENFNDQISPPESQPVTSPKARQPKPTSASPIRVRWDYVVVFGVTHLLALLIFVPYFFSWTGVVAFALSVFIFGLLGIPIAFHRMLAHKSFKSPKWFERTLVTLAMCTAQETPARWVAWHRKHHSHSDEQQDPHSPRVSFFWSHMDWLFHENLSPLATFSLYQKYAKDILADPYYRWIERLPQAAGIIFFVHAVLYAIVAGVGATVVYGFTAEAIQLAASIFVWGVIARTVYVWHITWAVNSVTHLIGYRTYETSDDSRNCWFVAILTLGEGWHNNHHADPASATVQHRWWELDPNYYIIKVFSWLGLATEIIEPRHIRKKGKS